MKAEGDAAPLIVTLEMDERSFEILDRLRREHFPPERNFLNAHITMFHALPGVEEAAVRGMLEKAAGETAVFPIDFPTVRFLGRGVAVDVNASELLTLRKRLAAEFAEWLRPQDRQLYRPHVTVQNKVQPTAARELFERMTATWEALAGRGTALLLWRYLGGPWELLERLAFNDAK